MVFLADLDFSLPLTNPVIIFSLVLFIILFAPILLNKIKVPYLIGLIVAGIIVGPYGFNLLLRDSSVVLFGTVGLLYIMFLAGLEIDIEEFKKNKFKSLLFGMLTFLTPMSLGWASSYYILGFTMQTSILLASMLSSHTLLAYPIASRLGIANSKAVTITVGGTMITDLLALLVLAVIVGMTQGDITPRFWTTLSVSIIVFVLIILLVFPLIARWFFKHYEDSVAQYIFVLAMVFMGGFLAEAAGIEAIIGAFLTGLALNKFIPHNSALMNRIGFVGNAIFIPFFLVGVGMLVDVRVFFQGIETIKVGLIMTAVVIIAKFLAAWFTQKSFKLTNEEGKLIFGLSVAQAAATLATVLVGYNIILGETANGDPIRLLNEDVLNGSILTILITCTISSLVVEKASKKIAFRINEGIKEENEKKVDKILVSVSEPTTVNDLMDVAFLIIPKKENADLFAIHIVAEKNETETSKKEAEKIINLVEEQAAGADMKINPITRYDSDVSKGILYTIKEHEITDVIIGVTQEGAKKHIIGKTTENILKDNQVTFFVHQSVQPFNTLKRIILVVNKKANLEDGFQHWVEKVFSISAGSGLSLIVFANEKNRDAIEQINQNSSKPLTLKFNDLADWDEFLILKSYVTKDDLFIVASSREGYLSHYQQLNKTPSYLSRYFTKNSYIIIYPEQKISYSKLGDLHQEEENILDILSDGKKVAAKAGNAISSLWKRKKT